MPIDRIVEKKQQSDVKSRRHPTIWSSEKGRTSRIPHHELRKVSLPKGLIHHVTSGEEDDDHLDCVRAMLGTLETGHRRRVPLKFIVRGVGDGPKTKTQAKAIASHVSGTHKRWRKVSAPQDRLCLDSSTKAILKPPVPQSLDEEKPSAPIKVEHISMSSLEIDVTVEEPRHGNGTVDDEETKAKRFASVSPSMESGVGSQILDPFTPLHERIDRKVEPHLHFYFRVVLPFARRLLKSWTWYDDLPLIQATPVLAYAVAAYASIFVSGCLGGGPLVVLPPQRRMAKDHCGLYHPGYLSTRNA